MMHDGNLGSIVQFPVHTKDCEGIGATFAAMAGVIIGDGDGVGIGIGVVEDQLELEGR